MFSQVLDIETENQNIVFIELAAHYQPIKDGHYAQCLISCLQLTNALSFDLFESVSIGSRNG